MINSGFSTEITIFHGRRAPETATLVGYGAVIEKLDLPLPMPPILSLISRKQRSYQTQEWFVYSSKAAFEDTLYKHLVFALKYEGINLLFFKKLADQISAEDMITLLQEEPTGQYTRKIWFLYEWLLNKQLDIADLTIKNYISLVDENLQYAIENGERSSRHRIINNLPGSRTFCPMIRKSPKLDKYLSVSFTEQKVNYLQGIRKDILHRASAFLLLKDSKASFSIEGESPKSKRAVRWGQAISQAGRTALTKEELIRLQQIVIENGRFLEMGFRKKGGFIGEHDRNTGEPLPDHISARWQDIDQLIQGLLNTNDILSKSKINAVLAATIIAFGFVFIHPFEDGNGRIHRYLIHHLLEKKQFSEQGVIFPVSASILDHIVDYRNVLEAYSKPLLDFIDWEPTKDHNINVLNDTIDYYRYFDATKQAEFLYDCVQDTIQNIIPLEIAYLIKYDNFKQYLEDDFEMPDKAIALLVRFLEQNNGKLSKRVKENESTDLTELEIHDIEENYYRIFL